MMPAARSPNISGLPSHRLGQYQSWDAGSGEDHPLDQIWISIAGTAHPAAHRVLPHGEASVAILRRRDNTSSIASIRLVICPPNGKAHWYRPEAGEELIAVRLKPEWILAAIDVSPAELLQEESSILDAPDRLKKSCQMSMRLAEYADASAVARMLYQDIGHAGRRLPPSPSPEASAMMCLRRAQGRIRTSELAGLIDVSERGLRRRFRALFGYSPKSCARQLRLTQAALMAEQSEAPAWAQLAHSGGFYDQAHMINEYRAILNLTPYMLHKERRALADICNTPASAPV